MYRTIALIALLATGLFAADAAHAQDGQRPRRQVEIRRAAPGWIGVSFVTVAPPGTGVVVEDVVANAPAERAGVMPGDTIVQWNRRTDVLAAIRATSLEPGDTVTIRIRRGGQRDRDLTVVAEARPRALVGPEVAERLREALTEMSRGLEVRRDSLWLRDRNFFLDSLRIELDSLRGGLPPVRGWRMLPGDSLFGSLDSLRFRGFRIPEFDREMLERGGVWLDMIRRPEIPWPPEGFREGVTEWIGPLMAVQVTRSRDALAGAQVTSLNPGLASYFGVDSGVLVLRVLPQTPAANAGLREGDVIVEAAGAPVTDVMELRRQMVDSRDGVELEIVRQRQRQTIVLGR